MNKTVNGVLFFIWVTCSLFYSGAHLYDHKDSSLIGTIAFSLVLWPLAAGARYAKGACGEGNDR